MRGLDFIFIILFFFLSKVQGDKIGNDKFGGDKVEGDKVGGDKFVGDKVGGNKIVGDTVGGDKVAGDKGGEKTVYNYGNNMDIQGNFIRYELLFLICYY